MKTRICRLHAAHDLRIETQTVPDLGCDEVQVAVGAGGICGSDLHYYHDGGIGQVRVQEPIIVGHEAAGRVTMVGNDVKNISLGDLVAINPSLPCHDCIFCHRRAYNHCINMRFMGSAYRMPHEQGMFREIVNVSASRIHCFTNSIPVREAACAEPLAVCLRAISQTSKINGLKVLVMGAGPIGALMTAVAARQNPADLIVTDIQDFPLSIALKMGADETINAVTQQKSLDRFRKEKGQFDVVFECTGVSAAIRNALEMLRPQGTMVLVGVAGDIPLPLNLIVSKEIRLVGTHRFHFEFDEAIRLINEGEIDVSPILTQSFAVEDAIEAFALAKDRTKAIKVHLTFVVSEQA